MNELSKKIRLLILDMIYKSRSSHIGSCYSVVEILVFIFKIQKKKDFLIMSNTYVKRKRENKVIYKITSKYKKKWYRNCGWGGAFKTAWRQTPPPSRRRAVRYCTQTATAINSCHYRCCYQPNRCGYTWYPAPYFWTVSHSHPSVGCQRSRCGISGPDCSSDHWI